MTSSSLLVALLTLWASAPGPTLLETRFHVARAGEAIATIVARCTPCDWGTRGREGAALVLSVDDRYSQHIVLYRGDDAAEYRVALGRLESGEHRLRITLDDEWTPSGMSVKVSDARVSVPGDPYEQQALAHAPILHARPDTIRRFTDVPLLSWYERESNASSTRLRYGVVFSNEDGGTPTDRLMATWGRPTDIEYVYWVELGARDDDVVSAGFEGPGHRMRSFAGARDDRHPLLWVATTNNMIEDRGETTVRVRPAPARAELSGVSREVVMDREPWTYAVSAKEIAREGRIRPAAPSGTGAIPDPRQFVYVEACGEVTNAALAVAVGITDGGGRTQWFTSDGGLPEFRIARSGCFRAAIALPSSIQRDRMMALRVTAFPRPLKKGEPSPERFQVRLTNVNQVFTLNERYVPGRTLLAWTGDVTLTREQQSFVVPLR